jgi:hypothetical protein
MIEELAQEEQDWAFVSADVDKVKEIAKEYRVNAMPTFMVFKDGQVWGTFVGALPKEEMRQKINTILQAEQSTAAIPVLTVNDLITAIAKNDLSEVEKLIAAKVDVNDSINGFPTGKTYPLQMAIVSGSSPITDLLIKSGAKMDEAVMDATEQHINAYERIHAATKETFEYAKGLETKATSSGKAGTVEEYMVAFASPDALKEYLATGIDANAPFDMQGLEMTPIYFAICTQNKEAINVLVEAGAKLDDAQIEKIQKGGDQLEQAIANAKELYESVKN